MTKADAGASGNAPLVELIIQSDLDSARAAEERILRDVEHCGYRPDEAFAIRLSLEEAITNAVKHGNANDRSKSVRIRYRVDGSKVEIWVADDGPGFDPDRVPDPTCPARLSLPNGRGIMLMRAYMDEVCYNRRGNEIHLVKRKG